MIGNCFQRNMLQMLQDVLYLKRMERLVKSLAEQRVQKAEDTTTARQQKLVCQPSVLLEISEEGWKLSNQSCNDRKLH